MLIRLFAPIFVFLLACHPSAAESPDRKTFGFIVVSLRTAIHETQYLDECPEGVAIGNDEIWWKGLQPRDRDRLTDGGQKEASSRRITATMRGPHGEDVCWNPTVVTDPPLRIIRSQIGYGLNLDGTQDGSRTAKSCQHQKFQSPDGATHVDNQMARLVGCIHGWRSGGYIEAVSDAERRDMSRGVILIEISGAQNLDNAPDVSVRFFRAADVMPKDSQGAILPYATYRTDENPRYGAVAHGRIVNGTLTTDPIDAHLPFYGNRVETEFFIRGLRLDLKLTDDRASGLLAGYHDLDNWWDYVRKMGYLVETAQFSCPALYVAAHKLADGYPTESGECSALSTAYQVQAARAFIVHPDNELEKSAHPIVLDTDMTRAPRGIGLQSTAMGDVLSAHNGMILYTPVDGCLQDCGAEYDPLAAPSIAVGEGQWKTIVDNDGERQWSVDGRPLYLCSQDRKAATANCTNSRWRPVATNTLANLPDWVTVRVSELGPVLADGEGHTLYRFIGSLDQFEKQICDQNCLQALWHPVAALPDSVSKGEWKPAADGNGRIWTFRGKPVYTFARDEGPGEISGHRFGGASVSVQNWFSALKKDEVEGSPSEKGE